jgi:hypothetical protein
MATTGPGYKIVDFSATSPASAITVAGTAVTGLAGYSSMTFYAALTGGTGGTLDLYLQWSPDEGTTWVDYAHFVQLASGATIIHRMFSTSSRAQQITVATIGVGSSPALAANTVVGGAWGDRLRVVMVAGASTSAGAAQVLKAVFTR